MNEHIEKICLINDKRRHQAHLDQVKREAARLEIKRLLEKYGLEVEPGYAEPETLRHPPAL